jgi:uncharacterized protein YlxP (DUF503 family)
VVIVVARVLLHLPGSQSLKDKRHVIKSLLAQVQRQFQVAAAEVDEQDRLQLGVLGLACISTETAHADAVIARTVAFLGNSKHDADLLDYQTEVVHVF